MMNPPFQMPGMEPPKPAANEHIAQAMTAAMLKAAKSTCTCEVCQIMRGVIDKMAEPFLTQNAPQPPGG